MSMTAEEISEGATGWPSAAVAPWVARYTGYRMAGFAPGVHVGMPSHRLTFIVSLDDPVDVAAMPDRRQRPQRFQALVSGLHDEPAEIAHDGDQHGIAVEVTPLGARALFGLPAGELAAQVVDLDTLLGPGARSWPERLRACPTWRARFALLDAALARVVTAHPASTSALPAEVVEAFRLLVVSGGAADIAGVARAVGWSRRHLATRFAQEVGLSPKPTARLVRFDRAKRLLEAAGPRRTLADVAAAVGYADQAHFTREFRTLAGRTPTRWLAEELPSVQDTEQVGAAP